MAQDHLQRRVAVEHAGQHQPQELHPRLVVPAQAEGREGQAHLVGEAAVQRFAHLAPRRLGVDEQGGAQAGGGLEHGLEVGMVQVLVAGAAAQQGALEAQPAHTALQLGRARGRGGGGQGGEAFEPLGMAGDRCGDRVVGAPRQFHALRWLQPLQRGGGQRQHLNVHSRLVHPAQPRVSHVGELRFHGVGVEVRAGIAVLGGQARPGVGDLAGEDVLLDGDQFHGATNFTGAVSPAAGPPKLRPATPTRETWAQPRPRIGRYSPSVR